MLFNTFSSNECIRLGYMPLDHPNLTAHQVSCDKTYHDFANLSLRLHAPLLLLVANLCIVFLFQLGGWSLDQCAKRRGVREAILTLLTGAVFLLPLVPVTVLSANGAMRIFTSLVIPMCFAAVLPLLCGLLVWWLDHKCALDLFNQLHGAYGRSGANSSISAHTALAVYAVELIEALRGSPQKSPRVLCTSVQHTYKYDTPRRTRLIRRVWPLG